MEEGLEAKIEVFNDYFSDLVTAIQSCTLSVTNRCLSKQLITEETQEKILNCSTSREKATNLLNAVRECMKHQRECFDRFLEILEKEHIFGDLIASLKAALERKVTAECTDTERGSAEQILPQQSLTVRRRLTPDSRPHTVKARDMMEMRRSVVKTYLPQLKSSVQGVVASVACKSLTKKLISKETYQRVMKTNQSKKPKESGTDYLLHQICTSVKKSSKKFDLFLEVLEKHSSCRDVVDCIKQEITATKESRLSTKTEVKNDTLQPHTVEEVDRAPLPDESGQVDKSNMVYGSGVTSDVRTNDTKVSVQSESAYQWRMDRKQNEVVVCQQKATIDKQDKQLESLSQEIAWLQYELARKDLESIDLREERNNLQTAIEQKKVRVSFLEKKQYKPDPFLEAKVTELEGKIKELNKEKVNLQEQLKTLEGKYHTLDVTHQETLATLKETKKMLEDTKTTMKANQTTLRDTQTTLRDTQTSLRDTQTTLRDTQTSLRDNRTTMKYTNKLFIFIIIIFCCFLLGCSLFIYFYFDSILKKFVQ